MSQHHMARLPSTTQRWLIGAALTAMVVMTCPQPVAAWELTALPELFRPDPFGGVVAVDQQGATAPSLPTSADGVITLTAPRNGYVSFHVVAHDAKGGEFMLAAEAPGGMAVDVFREWFHRNKEDGKYYPDALIPVASGQTLSLPDAQMKIEGQKAAAFWVDVWVPKTVAAGTVTVEITLTAGGAPVVLPIKLTVLELAVADEDAIVADGNCYGMGWVGELFPTRHKAATAGNFYTSDACFDAIHRTHELMYEHRGTFHQLGTSHSGNVGQQFAPELTGQGRTRRIKSWAMFDKHYGPLLDGSAFVNSRRGPKPIPNVYLPLTPEWPANYIWFGTKGYDLEFTRILSQMEQHFRQKGWTKTNFELFFNHKKRYRVFEWDGDETRFEKDNVYFTYYGRLLKEAVPADSPVTVKFRHDASWLMWNQFHELAGVVDFWVCGSGIFAFYPDAPKLLKDRGDTVWIYGGTPTIWEASAAVLDMPLKTWVYGIDGFIRWLVTKPGTDPFFDCDGAGTGLLFSGEMFGQDLPLTSVRLKLQRNMLQDLAVLDAASAKLGKDGPAKVRQTVASLAGVTPGFFWAKDAPITKLPAHEWSNAMIRDDMPKPVHEVKKLDGRWWLTVRDYAIKAAQAKEVKQ